MIWGDGDQRAALEQRVREEEISNVVFKGKVEKKYIPSIVSRADINLIHGGDQGKELFRFGISPNKMFDCFAAGRPILMDLLQNIIQWSNFKPGFVFRVYRRFLPPSGRFRCFRPRPMRAFAAMPGKLPHGLISEF